MRIIHLPYTFHPDPCGGTEIYVTGLAKELSLTGCESIIAAPGSTNTTYSFQNLEVRRYAITPNLTDLDAIYGAGDSVAANNFRHLLDAVRPELVHMHAFTSGVSIQVAKIIQERKIPLVFTYHTPTVSCIRGDLLYEGHSVCDGSLDADTCTKCIFASRGLNSVASGALNWVGREFSGLAGLYNLLGKAGSGLRLNGLIQLQHRSLRELCEISKRVVVLCRWSKELFERNNLASGKVSYCRHGVEKLPSNNLRSKPHPGEALRLLYLGRIDRTKGVDYLLEALKTNPRANIKLDLFTHLDESQPYPKQVKHLASFDSRINFRSPVNHSEISNLIPNYHLLVVPSRCLETGPLVVLEALAAGIPVAGSNLGGIAEWIVDGKNGFLVEPTLTGWTQFIARLSNGIPSLPEPEPFLRTMATVADEMKSIYADVLASR